MCRNFNYTLTISICYHRFCVRLVYSLKPNISDKYVTQLVLGGCFIPCFLGIVITQNLFRLVQKKMDLRLKQTFLEGSRDFYRYTVVTMASRMHTEFAFQCKGQRLLPNIENFTSTPWILHNSKWKNSMASEKIHPTVVHYQFIQRQYCHWFVVKESKQAK